MSEGPDLSPPATTPDWDKGVRRRMLFYLIAALLLGVLAGGLTYSYLQRLRAHSAPSIEAIVAAADIPPGTRVTAEMVQEREVPEALLPEGALTDRSRALGRVVVVPIVAGEVFLDAKLSGGRGANLSARLPEGKWAMDLPGGWLVSPVPSLVQNDRIDLLSYRPGDPLEEAGLIVTAVEVLAFVESGGVPDRLTLAVDLDQAITILYARANGFSLLPLLRPEGQVP
jgi:pilus assembly protein CpaB